MCICALPGAVVMDCINMLMFCPPGKPGHQLILLDKHFSYARCCVLLCFGVRCIIYVYVHNNVCWGWRKFNFKVELKKTPNHIKAFNINGMYFMVDKILIMINRYLYLIKVSYICLWIIPSMKIQTNEAFLLIG